MVRILKLIDELDLVRNARKTGAYFLSTMRDALARQPMVGEGLLCAVELVEDREARRRSIPSRRSDRRSRRRC